jgi:hypothetical protein
MELPRVMPALRGKVETARTVAFAGQSHGRVVVAPTVPEIYRPVSPSEKLPAFSPHSVSSSISKNRRLGDCLQMMLQRQDKS